MKKRVKNQQAGFTLIEYIVTLVIAAIMASMVYTYFGSAMTQSSVPITRLKQASNLHKVMENIVVDYNRLNEINLRYKWKAPTVYPVNSVVVPPTNNGHYYKCTSTSKCNENVTVWPITSAGTTTPSGQWTEGGLVRNTNTNYTAGDIVVPYNNNGHYYTTSTTGKSGLTEDNNLTWPTTTGGGPVVDGTVTWTEAGTILSKNAATATNSPYTDNLYDFLSTNVRYGTGYTVTGKSFIKFLGTGAESNLSSTSTEEKNILKVTITSNETLETLTQLFTIR